MTSAPDPRSVQLRVHNPLTGVSTGAGYIDGADHTRIVREIQDLAGQTTGFIELLRGDGKVLEILSPGPKAFMVIVNRNQAKAEIIPADSLFKRLAAYLAGQ